jgi:acyl-[acyl-carrier-protein]-phospholipid O-acyltransferase/long-chain-fatty-acid--[acyl-carrier-protein] ligase
MMTNNATDAEILRQARGKFACIATSYGLGVFNDNFFKQAALVLFVAAGLNDMQGYAMAVFTAPFILFSAPSGWCADRFMKSHVVVSAKWMELVAMLCGAVGICSGYSPLIFAMLFIMGFQATLFSPAMNGSLPDLYPERFITHANGILRMLVTLAILGGVAVAGMMLDYQEVWFWGIEKGRVLVAGTVVGVALIGLVVSYGVPKRPAANPAAKFPWSGPWHTLQELWTIRKDPLLATTIFTNVFVWLIGSLGILIINPLGIQQFHLSKTLTSCLIVSQLVGIAVGGVISSRLIPITRWYRVVWPLCLGMSLTMLVMPSVPYLPSALHQAALYGLTFLLGCFGGGILIPMESFLQIRPPVVRKGAVLSAVNFIVFIGILSSGLFSNYLNTHWKPTEAFGVMGVFSLGVTGVLYLLFRRRNEVIGG